MSETVLITGAAHGIGKAAAYRFAAEGCSLHLLTGNSAAELEDISSDLRQKYAIRCTTALVDVCSADEVRNYFETVIRGTKLDLLINNAGISHIGLLQDMSDEDWNRCIGTDLNSVFYFCRASIPLFLKYSTGRIINISSVWGNVGASCEAAYSAAKGGVNSLTKALAKELAPSGIPVNAVAFGVVNTRMNSCFSAEELEALSAEIPADRFASPEEAAETIFQLSRMPSYVTGQILTMDGGWT